MTGHTARIAELRESIARSALAAHGTSADVRILSVERIRSVFIVATEDPTHRWGTYFVESFRIPTRDITDRDCEPGREPKLWGALAGWVGDSPDELPGMLAKARTVAHEDADAFDHWED